MHERKVKKDEVVEILKGSNKSHVGIRKVDSAEKPRDQGLKIDTLYFYSYILALSVDDEVSC